MATYLSKDPATSANTACHPHWATQISLLFGEAIKRRISSKEITTGVTTSLKELLTIITQSRSLCGVKNYLPAIYKFFSLFFWHPPKSNKLSTWGDDVSAIK